MSTGTQRFGKYELIKRVGRGGMAEVWKALDTQLNRYVAIKFLHPDLRTDPSFMMRFVREAQAIAALHHPNIVNIHDFQITNTPGSDDSLAYMVMNFIEGPMLSEYIARTSRLGKYPPSADILNLFALIGRAIDYAHQRGMIHRDIKPTNILLDERDSLRHPMGNPILTDFGIVKLMGSAGSTLSGMMVGTPSYISPEQALGKPGNERSDIYSFGVILYEICTGVRPFQGDSAAAIIMQHISATPTPPHHINPNLPPAATEVILRCMAKVPEERFPNAASMVSALAQALHLPLSPGSGVPNTYVADTGNGPGSTNLEPQNFLSPSFAQAEGLQAVSGGLSTPIQRSEGKEQSGPYTPISGNSSSGASNPNQKIPGLETPVQPHLSPALTPIFPESRQHMLMGGQTVSAEPPKPPLPRKRRRTVFIASAVFLILVLLAAGLSTLYFLNPNRSSATPPIASVGTATFISSVTASGATGQGYEDELYVSLHNIAAPASGKSYYAWLLSDTGQPIQAISLGNLTVIDGNVNYIYHDQQDSNLLCASSRFVITEQDASQPPASFSTDTSAWRYYAELPQKLDTSENPTSVLKDLRVLLCNNTFNPAATSTTPGEVFGLIQSSQQVRMLIGAARNAQDTQTVHDDVVRILDYLDGAPFVKTDIPSGQSLLVDPKLVPVPLIDVSPGQTPAGYTSSMAARLQSLITDPGVTASMVSLANQALNAIANAQGNLVQVREDAIKLVRMNGTQLLQPAARDLLNSMFTSDEQANSATNGIGFVSNTIQNLPTFDIKPYQQ